MKKHRMPPLALFAVLPLLFACGGGDKKGAKGAESGAPAKKAFTFRLSQAPKTLDPVKQLDQISGLMVNNLYDTLLQYSYLKRPYQVEPNLLTKMPELSSDGLTYLFELRKDVRFIDDPCFSGGKGRTLVADDVIYTLKRFADANLNVNSYMLLQGMVDGMDAFHEQTKQLGKDVDYGKLNIAGIQKLDDQHFTIKLTQPNPRLLLLLAVSPTSIVPREAIARYQDEFQRHPVGSGPFKMKTLSRRGVTILEKNPHYHQTYPTEGDSGTSPDLLKDAGKSLPLVDELHLPLIEEAQPTMLKFLSGQLDWIAMDEDNFAKMVIKDASGFRLQPEYAKKFKLYAEPSLSTEYMVFNLKDPILGKNKALRQAIAYALDAPAFIEQMRNGRAEALTTIVPTTIAGSQVEVKVEGYSHNLALAKQKLAQAGYKEGKGLAPITMDFASSDSRRRKEYEFFRAQLAKVGIVLKPNFQTWTSYLQRIEDANFQMTFAAWGADYPDAENFYQLLYSANKAPGPNHASYNNPEYDKLYEQSRFMSPGPERHAIFARMSEILREDVPVVVSDSWIVVGLYQPWVKNFKRHMMIDLPAMYFDIDSAAKAKGVR